MATKTSKQLHPTELFRAFGARTKAAKARGLKQHSDLPTTGIWQGSDADRAKKAAEPLFLNRGKRLEEIIFSQELQQVWRDCVEYIDHKDKLTEQAKLYAEQQLTLRLKRAMENSRHALERQYQRELAKWDAAIAWTIDNRDYKEHKRQCELKAKWLDLKQQEERGLDRQIGQLEEYMLNEVQAKSQREALESACNIFENISKPNSPRLAKEFKFESSNIKLPVSTLSTELLHAPTRDKPIIYTRKPRDTGFNPTFNYSRAKRNGQAWLYKLEVYPHKIKIIPNPDKWVVPEKNRPEVYAMAIDEARQLRDATTGMKGRKMSVYFGSFSKTAASEVDTRLETLTAARKQDGAEINKSVRQTITGAVRAPFSAVELVSPAAKAPDPKLFKQDFTADKKAQEALQVLQMTVNDLRNPAYQERLIDRTGCIADWQRIECLELRLAMDAVNQQLKSNGIHGLELNLFSSPSSGSGPKPAQLAAELQELDPNKTSNSDHKKALQNFLHSGYNQTREHRSLVSALERLNSALQPKVYGRELQRHSEDSSLGRDWLLNLSPRQSIAHLYNLAEAGDITGYNVAITQMKACVVGKNTNLNSYYTIALEKMLAELVAVIHGNKLNKEEKATGKKVFTDFWQSMLDAPTAFEQKQAIEFIRHCQRSANVDDHNITYQLAGFLLSKAGKPALNMLISQDQECLREIILMAMTPKIYKGLSDENRIMVNQLMAGDHVLQRVAAQHILGAEEYDALNNDKGKDTKYRSDLIIMRVSQAIARYPGLCSNDTKLDILMRELNTIPYDLSEKRIAIAKFIQNNPAYIGLTGSGVQELHEIITLSEKINIENKKVNKFLNLYHSPPPNVSIDTIRRAFCLTMLDGYSIAEHLNAHAVQNNLTPKELVELRHELLKILSPLDAARLLCEGEADTEIQARSGNYWRSESAKGDNNSRLADFKVIAEADPKRAADVFWMMMGVVSGIDGTTDFRNSDPLFEYVAEQLGPSNLLEEIVSHPEADIVHLTKILDKVENPQDRVFYLKQIANTAGNQPNSQAYIRQAQVYSCLDAVDSQFLLSQLFLDKYKQTDKQGLDNLMSAMLALNKEQAAGCPLNEGLYQQHIDRCADLLLYDLQRILSKMPIKDRAKFAIAYLESIAEKIEPSKRADLYLRIATLLPTKIDSMSNIDWEYFGIGVPSRAECIEHQNRFRHQLLQLLTAPHFLKGFKVDHSSDINMLINLPVATLASVLTQDLQMKQENTKQFTELSRITLIKRLGKMPVTNVAQLTAKYELVKQLRQHYAQDGDFIGELDSNIGGDKGKNLANNAYYMLKKISDNTDNETIDAIRIVKNLIEYNLVNTPTAYDSAPSMPPNSDVAHDFQLLMKHCNVGKQLRLFKALALRNKHLFINTLLTDVSILEPQERIALLSEIFNANHVDNPLILNVLTEENKADFINSLLNLNADHFVEPFNKQKMLTICLSKLPRDTNSLYKGSAVFEAILVVASFGLHDGSPQARMLLKALIDPDCDGLCQDVLKNRHITPKEKAAIIKAAFGFDEAMPGASPAGAAKSLKHIPDNQLANVLYELYIHDAPYEFGDFEGGLNHILEQDMPLKKMTDNVEWRRELLADKDLRERILVALAKAVNPHYPRSTEVCRNLIAQIIVKPQGRIRMSLHNSADYATRNAENIANDMLVVANIITDDAELIELVKMFPRDYQVAAIAAIGRNSLQNSQSGDLDRNELLRAILEDPSSISETPNFRNGKNGFHIDARVEALKHLSLNSQDDIDAACTFLNAINGNLAHIDCKNVAQAITTWLEQESENRVEQFFHNDIRDFLAPNDAADKAALGLSPNLEPREFRAILRQKILQSKIIKAEHQVDIIENVQDLKTRFELLAEIPDPIAVYKKLGSTQPYGLGEPRDLDIIRHYLHATGPYQNQSQVITTAAHKLRAAILSDNTDDISAEERAKIIDSAPSGQQFELFEQVPSNQQAAVFEALDKNTQETISLFYDKLEADLEKIDKRVNQGLLGTVSSFFSDSELDSEDEDIRLIDEDSENDSMNPN